MPTTFVVENICIGENMHMFMEIPTASGKICQLGYYAFFFSQLELKIMKVVSLKMVTNMYRDLRSECTAE